MALKAPSHIFDPKPNDLLEYLPHHKVLICKQCRYAVPPRSLPRHLKEIHHIIRTRRNPFLQYATKFPAVAEPHNVQPPSSDQFPVPFLPVEQGLACKSPGCAHLCVTDKRMKAHWIAIHRRQGEPGIDYTNAPLQTFFRGSHLRYFTKPPSQVIGKHDGRNRRRNLYSVVSDMFINQEPTVQSFYSSSHSNDISILPPSSLKPILASKDLLLNHWARSTSISISQDEMFENVWQCTVSQLATESSFLSDGLCACAAFHLAYLNPTEEAEWMLEAVKYQNKALPDFNLAITDVTESNFEAIFSFSYLLIISVFASERGGAETHYLLDRHPTSRLPSWLHMIRGSCSMLCNYWDLLEKGSLSVLSTVWDDPVLEPGEVEKAIFEELLQVIPSPTSQKVWSEKETEIYTESAQRLALALQFVAIKDKNLLSWETLSIWAFQLHEDTMALLDQGHPGILILLGYYCLILKRHHPLWFMQGSALRLFRYVQSCLDDYWNDYLKGVAEEIEIQGFNDLILSR